MPTTDAPTFYPRAESITSMTFDPFFRSLDPAIHADSETGSVDSPLGHVMLVQVDDALISPTDDPRPPQGIYIVRSDEYGFTWGIGYGWDKVAAEADWADAVKADNAYWMDASEMFAH